MITPTQIVILGVCGLVIISFILNFVYQKNYWDCPQTTFSYIAEIFMYIGTIIVILAIIFDLSNKAYKNALVLLYFADVFSLGSIFSYAFWPMSRLLPVGLFNWAALLSFFTIIILIILLHVYLMKNPAPPTVTMTIPINQMTPDQLQVPYKQC